MLSIFPPPFYLRGDMGPAFSLAPYLARKTKGGGILLFVPENKIMSSSFYVWGPNE